MSAEDAAEALALEPTRFQGEGGDLALLYALRKAEQAAEAADEDILRKAIQPLHTFFLTLLVPSPTTSNASSPSASSHGVLPKPGRPIRHLVSRILVTLHRRVESRSLFDFIQAVLKGLQDGPGKNMSVYEGVQRVAGWEVVGEVMRDLGTNMMSFMGDITLAAVKVLRNANLPVILRVHAVQAFSKALVSAGRALQEGLVKDLLKALRAGLSDKALPVQRAVADAFIALNLFTAAAPLGPTLDSVAPLIIKSFETTDHLTRRSLSRLLAHLLARTQEPGSGAPVAEPPKKGKATEEVDGNEPNVITSAPQDKSGRTLLTTTDMLKYLSVPYNKPNTPRRVRNALIDVYAGLFTQLGGLFVEGHYPEIARHLMDELVLSPRAQSTRSEVLSARESMRILLRDLIGTRLLSESGQVMAIREWAGGYLSKWSLTPLPGQANTSKHALIVALQETGGLLEQLGNAPAQILEVLADPLVRLLSHDSYSVRVAASATLRVYCASNPSQLPRLLDVLLADLDKELSMLGTPTAPKEISQRIVGKALALAALVSLTASRPLYVSHDIPTRVFDMAVSLLKKAGDADVKTSGIQVQVAWNLIAALMSLGPGFVKMHLPQLLVLWRNALPKPTSKDSTVGERGEAEWSFLLLVRECTLSAVLNFLRHNTVLLNIDVARRLATLFTNSLNFVNGFATAYAEALREQAAINAGAQQAASGSGASGTSALFASRAGDGVSLVEREANLRRRVLQCFTALGGGSSGHSATESMQGALLQAAITVFADPENYAGSGGASAAQQAIAAQSGQFTNVWAATDGYAFGLTSGMKSREVEGEEREEGYLNRDKIEMAIECQLTKPIATALEHDFLNLLSASSLRISPPAQTGVIDAGVDLFATLFAQQAAEGMVQSLGTLSSNARSSKLERNPGRRQAVVANTVAALRRALGTPDVNGQRARKALGSVQVFDLAKNILQDAVLDPQATIRQAAAECMGLLAGISSGNYLSTQVQWLVDQVVNNRVPESRAGCALAFGSIYSSVGGLAGGPILKTIVNILMSLATDPHPIVHFWAMVALAQVVNVANLSYEPFVPNTLGMLSSIYLMETHEPDGGSLGSVNLRGDLPAYQVILRILHALIGVIGPELQEPGKVRSLVFLLVHEFGEESDEGLAVEAIKCVQQFLMFAPNEVDVPALLAKFRVALASSRRPLKGATITALYQIVQRDAVLISKLGGNQLVEDLFGLLDDDPSLEGVKNVITAWLGQTAAALPGGWIDLCQRIMTRTAAAAAAAKAKSLAAGQGQKQSQFMDDEGEGFAGDAGSASATASSGLSSRWRTQLFALQCLHDIIRAVIDLGRREHIDANLARSLGVNTRQMLYSRVADLIRMAFSASAAQVVQVRLQGLVVLRDVIEAFATSPDPDFEGSSSLLLEQHQAPIAAALTPSFGKDAPPEVVALAVRVCATFVGCGVVKEISRMGRILRLLSNALEQCKDGATLSLGDVNNLSTNAAVMLKVSVLTAWAELQVASTKQAYLVDVVKPYRWLLGPLWIGSLRDYALLRTDPEMGAGMDVAEVAGMSRDVLLPYYEQSVPKLLHAISIALAASDAFALGAMDGQTFSSGVQPTNPPAIRPESSPAFYVIYGLSFETLVKAMGDASTAPLACVALNVMASLVRPILCGTGIFGGAFFDELITVAYRIGMSEPASVKAEMMNVLSAFVTSRSGQMVIDQAQVRRCLAVVTLTLRQVISSSEAKSTFSHADSVADRVACVKNGFSAFMRIIEAIPEPGERADLMVVALHLYGDLIKDETRGMGDVGAATLPLLKQLVDAVIDQDKDAGKDTAGRALHGLVSSMLTNVDDMRSRLTAAANLKIKTSLLALTLVLTTLPSTVPVSRPLVESVADTIATHLGSNTERPELGLTAVHCASTFLTSSLRPASHPALGHAIVALIPGVVTFLSESVVAVAATLDESGGDPSADALRTIHGTSEAVREAIKALVSWCQAVEDSYKPRVYAVLLPTMGLLLDRDEGASGGATRTPLHAVGAAALLSLAQTSPTSFKDAMAAMEAGERARLEQGLRGAVGQQGGQAGGVAGAKKGIELKSFG